jgi:PAS domain S-box-containing protein
MDKDRSYQPIKNKFVLAPPDPLKPVSLTPRLTVLQEFAAAYASNFYEFLFNFFDKMPQAVILADRAGQVVVFNRAAGTLLGYQPEEVVGHCTLWDFCNGAANPPAFQAALQKGLKFPDEEVEMQARNTRQGPFKALISGLYGQDGGLLGATANLGSPAEIRADGPIPENPAHKASISGLVSAIAHEINNPLQTLRTSLELGLDPRKTPHRRKGYLQAADREISRIARTITLLQQFHPASGSEKLPGDSDFSVQAALDLLDQEIKHKQNNQAK